MSKPDIIVVTGSREWTDADQIAACLQNHPPGSILIHGGCRGADRIAEEYANFLGHKSWELPYFEYDGREARNASMVAIGVALQRAGHRVTCYAFPLPGGRGTQKCMGLMRKAGLRIANAPTVKP